MNRAHRQTSSTVRTDQCFNHLKMPIFQLRIIRQRINYWNNGKMCAFVMPVLCGIFNQTSYRLQWHHLHVGILLDIHKWYTQGEIMQSGVFFLMVFFVFRGNLFHPARSGGPWFSQFVVHDFGQEMFIVTNSSEPISTLPAKFLINGTNIMVSYIDFGVNDISNNPTAAPQISPWFNIKKCHLTSIWEIPLWR